MLLFLKNLLFTVVVPGTVAFYVPLLLADRSPAGPGCATAARRGGPVSLCAQPDVRRSPFGRAGVGCLLPVGADPVLRDRAGHRISPVRRAVRGAASYARVRSLVRTLLSRGPQVG